MPQISSSLHVSPTLDNDGDLEIRIESRYAYLDAAGRSALVKAINEAEGACLIAPPAEALEAVLAFVGQHGCTVSVIIPAVANREAK